MEKSQGIDGVRVYVTQIVESEFGGNTQMMIDNYQEAVEEPFGKFPEGIDEDSLTQVWDIYLADHFRRGDVARREFAEIYLDLLRKRMVYLDEDGPGYAKSMDYAVALARFVIFCDFTQKKARLTRGLGLDKLSRKLLPNGTGLSFEEMGEIGKELNLLLQKRG